MSRRHNNANILALGGRILDTKTAKKIVETWLKTPFEGERHQKRLDKIAKLENCN
jgi:ribose 5-phosphate isomerase B